MANNRLVMFVCTGNICRSPMAEYILRSRLEENSEWEVCSAGVIAEYGRVASVEAIDAVNELGIDLKTHRSRPIEQELVDAVSVIVVMTASHREQIRTLYPHAIDKVRLMMSFNSDSEMTDVADPIGLPIEAYRESRDNILSGMDGLIEYLAKVEKGE